jgi:ABC-type multidrug transport system permease subunit
VFQAVIVLLLSVLLGFKVQAGPLGLVLVVIFMGMLAITAVGLGLITATLAKSTGAASGLSMIFLVPMMMFGTFLAVFDETTRAIARFAPNYYATDSLFLILNGSPLSNGIIWQNLLILMAISLVVVVVGMQLFKRTEFR